MRINELIKKQKQMKTRNTLPPLQKKVLDFFEKHQGEVFWYGDKEMLGSSELSDEKDTAIRWSVWTLEQKGFLGKIKVGRKTYFGLPEDVEKAKSELEEIRKRE